MNIDIKNAIDKLLVACSSLRTIVLSRAEVDDLDSLVMQDILAFIDYISIDGSQDRLAIFKASYLNSSYENIGLKEYSGAVPESFHLLCSIDNAISERKDILVSSLYISAIFEIGKFYSLSKFDKKQIDSDRFKEYMNLLNSHLAKTVVKTEDSVNNKGTALPQEAQNISNVSANKVTEIEKPEESLEELMAKLDELIGLSEVKKEVNTLINQLKINKIREDRGFKVSKTSKHLVFLGNPGTGKTTVARLISKIYKQLGVLETGQLIEADRSGLVAGYTHQKSKIADVHFL